MLKANATSARASRPVSPTARALPTANARTAAPASANLGGDYSGVPLTRSASPSHFDGEAPVSAMSASGSGTVSFDYAPEATDKSTKIVLIQVMRELLDGVPKKPSEVYSGFSYRDADTTGDKYHVDYVKGESDPYYNGDDKPQDFGTQGNATTTPPIHSTSHDHPDFGTVPLPTGTSNLVWEFRTAAYSAAGADAGTYYGYSDWSWAKAGTNTGATALAGDKSGDPGDKFKSAVSLFRANHGGLGKGASALVGAGVGGVAGAIVGGVAGGPLGALAGGLIGAGLGAGIGALLGN